MDNTTRMDMMKLLGTIAWADDELTRNERWELRRCAREIGLDEIEQDLILEELEVPADPISLETLYRTMRADGRHEVLALARMVALADGRLDDSEARVLRVLSAATHRDGAQRGARRPRDRAAGSRTRGRSAES